MSNVHSQGGADRRDVPLVSVMIVTYNQQDFVADTIESVLAQDYANLQIVVSDDCSTDSTAEILRDLAGRNSNRITAIFQPRNVGVTANCNAALRLCTGRYVAFLGGDDLFLPGKVSAQVAWLAAARERVLCGHQVEVFYDDSSWPPHRFQRTLHTGRGADTLIRRGSFAACSVMVRADALPQHGFEESLPVVSDFMLWVETLAGGGTFGYVPGVYARYRRHSANVSANVPLNVDEAARGFDLIAQRYPQYADSCRRAYGRFVHLPLGSALLSQGRKREARAELLKAVRLEPGLWRAWPRLLQSLI